MEEPKLYIPTETEGVVPPPVSVPEHLREIALNVPVGATPKQQQSVLHHMRSRGLVSPRGTGPTVSTQKPSIANALGSMVLRGGRIVDTFRDSNTDGNDPFGIDAKANAKADGPTRPGPVTFNGGMPSASVHYASATEAKADPMADWTGPDGKLRGNTPEENRILDELSRKCGFDVRGDLTKGQQARVREQARKARKMIVAAEDDISKKWKATHSLIKLLDTAHTLRADAVAKIFPVHYRSYYPKDIVVPSNYYDPKHLASVFACADIMRMDYMDGNQNKVSALPQIQGIVITGHLWSKIKCPVFFLSQGLAEAIHATDLPNDYGPPPLKWPLPSFALMLARGMLQLHGQDVASIVYARTSTGVRIGRPTFDNGPFDRMYMDTWSCADIVAEPPPDMPAPEPLQMLTITMANGDTTCREFVDHENLDYSPNRFVLGATQEISGPMRDDCLPALLFAIKLLLVLQHSPGLVERTSDVVHEHGKPRRTRFDPNAKWSANFMGRNYRMRGSGGEGDGDKRPHLRRGHARRQHYGPGRKLIKDIWIEPVFVNRAKWKPGDPIEVVVPD